MVRGGTPVGDKGKGAPAVNGGGSRTRPAKQQTESATAGTSVAKRTRGAQHHDHTQAATPVTPSGKKQAGKAVPARSSGKRAQTASDSAEPHANGTLPDNGHAPSGDDQGQTEHTAVEALNLDAGTAGVNGTHGAQPEPTQSQQPSQHSDHMKQSVSHMSAVDDQQQAPAAPAAAEAGEAATQAATAVADTGVAADQATGSHAGEHAAVASGKEAAAAVPAGEGAAAVKQELQDDMLLGPSVGVNQPPQQAPAGKSAGKSAPKRKRASEVEQMMEDAKLVLGHDKAHGGTPAGAAAAHDTTKAAGSQPADGTAADATTVTAQLDAHGSDHASRYPSRARRASGTGAASGKDSKEKPVAGTPTAVKDSKDSKDKAGIGTPGTGKHGKDSRDKVAAASPATAAGDRTEPKGTAAAAAAAGSKAGASALVDVPADSDLPVKVSPSVLAHQLSKAVSNAAHTVAVPEPQAALLVTPPVAMDVDLVLQPPLPLPVSSQPGASSAQPLSQQAVDMPAAQPALQRALSGVRQSSRRHVKTSKAIEMDDLDSDEELDDEDMIEYKPALGKQPAGKAHPPVKHAPGSASHASKAVKVERVMGSDGVEPSSKRFRASDSGMESRAISISDAQPQASDAAAAGKKRKESADSDGYATVKQLPAMYDPFAVCNPPTYLAPLVPPIAPTEQTPVVVIGGDREQYRNAAWDSVLSNVMVAVAPTQAEAHAYSASPPKYAPPHRLISGGEPAPRLPPLAPPPPPATKPSHKKQKTSAVPKPPAAEVVALAPPPPTINQAALPDVNMLAPPPPPLPSTMLEAPPPPPAPLPAPATTPTKTKIHIHVKGHKKGGKGGNAQASQPPVEASAPTTELAPPPPPLPPSAAETVTEDSTVLAPRLPLVESAAPTAPPSPSPSQPHSQQPAAPQPQPSSIEAAAPPPAVHSTEAVALESHQELQPTALQPNTAAAAEAPATQDVQEGATEQPVLESQAGTAALAEGGLEQPAEALTDPRLILAHKIREHFHYQLPGSLNSKHLMQTGLLDGMEIEYVRRKDGLSRIVINTGMFERGLVRCFCKDCKNKPELVNLGVFELHAGSLNKKPIEHVYFTHMGICLKELILLVLGEPLPAHGLYLPWPETKNTRNGHTATSVIGPRRAQAGVAQLVAAERASARSLAPGASQEDEDAALAAMAAAAHTAAARTRQAARRVPAPPSSLAALNLPLHATTKVKLLGPTTPDAIPVTFRLDYWLDQCKQGLFRPATTAHGATLPEQEEKAALGNADKVKSELPAADSVAQLQGADGSAPSDAAGAVAPAPTAADAVMQDVKASDAASTVDTVMQDAKEGNAADAATAPLATSTPAGAEGTTQEASAPATTAADSGKDMVAEADSAPATQNQQAEASRRLQAAGATDLDTSLKPLAEYAPAQPAEQEEATMALQIAASTPSLVLEPPAGKETPVNGGVAAAGVQGAAQQQGVQDVEMQEGQTAQVVLTSPQGEGTVSATMPGASDIAAGHAHQQPPALAQQVANATNAAEAFGTEVLNSTLLPPAQQPTLAGDAAGMATSQAAGQAASGQGVVSVVQQPNQVAMTPQPLTREPGLPQAGSEPVQSEQQAALQVLQALQEAPQPSLAPPPPSTLPPAPDLQPFLQLLQGAQQPDSTPQQFQLQQLLEAMQTPSAVPTPTPQLPEQQLPSAQLSDGQARQSSLQPRELQMQEAAPVMDDKYRTMAHVDGQWIPRPSHIAEPPPGKMVRATTQRNKNKHQRLFEPGEGSLRHGQHVTYRLHGANLLEGTISLDGKGATGILCFHCNTVVSPSTFEAHAGHKQRRNPYDAIITDEGVTLRDMALRLPPLPEELNWQYVAIPGPGSGQGSGGGAGRVSGSGKAGGSGSKHGSAPATGPGSRSALNNLLARRMPAIMPGSHRVGRGRAVTFGAPRNQQQQRPPSSAQAGRAEDAVAAAAAAAAAAAQAQAAPPHEDGPQLSAITSSCVICFDASFDREGFSDRTVLICDQCEREFHVGCLQRQGHTQLQHIPDGHWFCSGECALCHAALNAQVETGEMVVSDDGHTLRVMKGRDGSLGTARNLHQVLETLQEGFDPILSSTDGMDMLPSMVLAIEHGDFDFQGMYSLLLKHRGKPVCAGLMRVFGSSLAELPLIATKLTSRRQGHAKVFMRALEERLRLLQVRVLALPAAHDAVVTWVRGFQFRYMHPAQLQYALSELRLLLFPGTQVMYKDLTGSPSGELDFKGVEGGAPYLTSAYPAGLPDEIQVVVEQQARAIADDCYHHQLDPEPWMPPPSASAVAALEAARTNSATPAAQEGSGPTGPSKSKPPLATAPRQPQMSKISPVPKLPTPPPALPLQAALPASQLRFPSPSPQLANLPAAVLPALAQLAQQAGSPAAAAAALARMPQAAMMLAAASAALQQTGSGNAASAQQQQQQQSRQRPSPLPLSLPPFQTPASVSSLQLGPGALPAQQSGLQVISPSAPKAADLPSPLDLSAPLLASTDSVQQPPAQQQQGDMQHADAAAAAAAAAAVNAALFGL